jgi:hypothetical protein
MILNSFSSHDSLLSSKQLTQFTLSEKAFADWAESHSAQEIEQAIVELNDFKVRQDAAIDEQLARQRDEASVQATINQVVEQAQKKYVAESPWFPLDPATREVNAKILWDRTLAVAQGEGTVLEPADMSDESLEAFGNEVFRLMMKAAQQLWNERRFYGIAWDQPHTHTPFNLFEPNYDHALDPENMPTPEEVEAALERGEISLDDVKAIADAQLMREAQAEAESRGEVYRPQADIEVPLSIRQPAPESGSHKGERGFAALMFGTNVDRRRG